jgi:hypothetical protein
VPSYGCSSGAWPSSPCRCSQVTRTDGSAGDHLGWLYKPSLSARSLVSSSFSGIL